MRTTEQIKIEGCQALVEKLGILDTEKFIFAIHKEPFDYTAWQSNLFQGKNAKEISSDAMSLRKLSKRSRRKEVQT